MEFKHMLSKAVDWEFIDKYQDDGLYFQPKFDGISCVPICK